MSTVFSSLDILFHFRMSHYVSKMGCGCHFMTNLKAWGEWVYKWVATWRDSVIMPSGAVCHFHGGKPLWSGVENGFAHKKGTHKCSAKQSSNEGLFFTVSIFQCTVPPREERVVDPFEVADAGPRLKLLRDAQQFRLSFIILSGTLICFWLFLVATYFRYPAHTSLSLSRSLSALGLPAICLHGRQWQTSPGPSLLVDVVIPAPLLLTTTNHTSREDKSGGRATSCVF